MSTQWIIMFSQYLIKMLVFLLKVLIFMFLIFDFDLMFLFINCITDFHITMSCEMWPWGLNMIHIFHCTFKEKFWAISSFVTMFAKSCLLPRRQKASILGKGLKAKWIWFIYYYKWVLPLGWVLVKSSGSIMSNFSFCHNKCKGLIGVCMRERVEPYWVGCFSLSKPAS